MEQKPSMSTLATTWQNAGVIFFNVLAFLCLGPFLRLDMPYWFALKQFCFS